MRDAETQRAIIEARDALAKIPSFLSSYEVAKAYLVLCDQVETGGTGQYVGETPCNACMGGRADPAAHCEGCGQHLWRSLRFPDVWSGVQMRGDCRHHPSGFHRPAVRETVEGAPA